MAHTSLNFLRSFAWKVRNLISSSLNCSVTRLWSSVRRMFSSENFLSIAANESLAFMSFSLVLAILRRWIWSVPAFSWSLSTSTL